MSERIYLSPPHMSGHEQKYVNEAFDTNWVAPLGPNVDQFEAEFGAYVGSPHAAALSSGTAALHLALVLCGVGADDEVVVSSLTFVASVNPITYVGARPVLVDSETESWNMDPDLLEEAIRDRIEKRGRPPKAVLAVHLYGQSADLDRIVDVCRRYDVVLIEDAAEVLGATYWGANGSGGTAESGAGTGSGQLPEPVSGQVSDQVSGQVSDQVSDQGKAPGTFGRIGIFSFNGNKIITTSGGGMLVSDDVSLVEHARKLATQARDPAPHYQHTEVGYNYRMSNIIAGVGRGQLQVIDDRVAARRKNFEAYREGLGSLPGLEFQPEATWGRHTRWLTCLLVDGNSFGASRDEIRVALEAENIECRPLWKPMHLQPLYENSLMYGGAVADQLFETGLCIPSGSSLTAGDRSRIMDLIRGLSKNP